MVEVLNIQGKKAFLFKKPGAGLYLQSLILRRLGQEDGKLDYSQVCGETQSGQKERLAEREPSSDS